MIDVKRLLVKAVRELSHRQEYIATTGTKTIDSAGTYNLCQLTLPRGTGAWIVLSSVHSNVATNHQIYNRILSTGARVWEDGLSRNTSTNGNGVASWAYIICGSEDVAVTLQCYGYYTVSHTETGKLVAIRL